MIEVKVAVPSKDRKVGTMVKVLSFEVGGTKSVVGASKEFLQQHGHLVFWFVSEEKAQEFRESVALYLPGLVAQVLP